MKYSSRKIIFDLEEGEAILIYPGKMSTASIDDLEALLLLAVKRLRRADAKDSAEDDDAKDSAEDDDAPPATKGGA